MMCRAKTCQAIIFIRVKLRITSTKILSITETHHYSKGSVPLGRFWYIKVELFLPKPMSFSYRCMTAYSIILVGYPNNEDYVKCRCSVIKEFRHNCLHS